MSILRGSVINLTCRVIGVALGLGLTWITARLGTTDRGTYSIFTLVAQIFITTFAGFGPALTFRMSRHREAASVYLPALLKVGIFAGSIFALTLIVITKLFDRPPYSELKLLAIATPALLITPYINGILLYRRKMLLLNLNNLAPSICCVAVLFFRITVSPPLKLDTILVTWSITQVLAGVIAIFTIQKNDIFSATNFKSIKALLPFSREVALTNLVTLLNYRADLLAVQFFIGLSAVGIYSIAVSVAELLWFVSSSITEAAYSRIGMEDDQTSAKFVVRIVHLNLFLLLLATPAILLASYFLLPIVFGNAYSQSVTPLLILLPGTLLYGAASTLSAFFTNRLGRPDLPKKIALVSLIINIAGSLILLPVWGVVGAALASSVAYGLSMVFSFYLFIRYSHLTWRDVFFADCRRLRSDIFRLLMRKI